MGGNVAVDVWICSIVNCCRTTYRPSMSMNMDLLVEMNMCMRISPLPMNLCECACFHSVRVNSFWVRNSWQRQAVFQFNSSSAGAWFIQSSTFLSLNAEKTPCLSCYAACYHFICISWFYCESSQKPSEIYLVCLSRTASESVGCEIYAGAIHLLLISRARLRDIFEQLTFHRFSASLESK